METNEPVIIPDDYLERLPALVQSAKSRFADHIEQRLKKYETRKKKRKYPVVALLGHGRCGKDLGALWAADNYAIEYSGSVSEFVAPLIAHAVDQDEDEVYHARHANRMFWKEFCNELRRHDPTFLVKMCLAEGDMVAGIRAATELEACLYDVFDLAVWVDNPRVDNDPTLEFTMDDCDISVRNASSKLDYFGRLRRLMDNIGIPGRN